MLGPTSSWPHRTFLHPFRYGCRLSTVCAAGPDLGRPHKAHMWQLKWLPPNGTHVGHTFFATVAHVWPTCDRCLAHMWPTYSRQEAHMWQTTGPHVAISRYINGKQEVNAWHSTGTEVAHVWKLFWPTTGPYVAMNRYRNGNQDAHTWQ